MDNWEQLDLFPEELEEEVIKKAYTKVYGFLTEQRLQKARDFYLEIISRKEWERVIGNKTI